MKGARRGGVRLEGSFDQSVFLIFLLPQALLSGLLYCIA